MDLDQFKQAQSVVWGLGDYPTFGAQIDAVSERAVARAGVAEGERVLDVATGTGNAALRAGRRGAHVTGLDLSPGLLTIARQRAAAEQFEIEFIEGDAESLPFPDGGFDRAISVFGAMFAPRQELAAAELLRVVRPGGAVVLTAWTPESVMGRMIALNRDLVPASAQVPSPAQWGDEDHARAMFADASEVVVERESVTLGAESVEAHIASIESNLGPIMAARSALEPEGRWDEGRSRLYELHAGANQASDGSMAIPAEYLMVVATV